MFLYIYRLWTSYILMVGPYLHLVSRLSLDPCVMRLITDFDIVYESDDSRSRFRHFFTSPYHSGSTGLLKFRVFLSALPQSSKIMIFREIEIKGAGGCYKLILTVIFLKSFPDWSDPKRVCPYQVCGSRNTFFKSPTWLHTMYWGWNLIGTLLFKDFPLQITIFRSEIGFRLNINNQIDIDQFFINSLHVWRWWQIISWSSHFRNVFVHCVLFDSDFQISKE